MSSKSKRFGMSLRFATRKCVCGGIRIAGQLCPDCGARPRPAEVDLELQRRQRVAAAYRARSAELEGLPGSLLDLTTRAAGVVSPFLRALSNLSESLTDDPSELLRAGRVLDQLLADSSLPQLRPWRRAGRVVHHAVEELHGSLNRFVDAFSADTLLSAQAIQADAQARLDAAAAMADDLALAIRDVDQILNAPAGRVLEALASRVRDLLLAEEPRSILDVDHAWKERVRAIVGPDEPLEGGVGLAVLWSTAFAEVLFDYDEYLMAASGTYELLRSDGFEALTMDTGWLANQERAVQVIVDAGVALDAVLAAARHDAAAVRAMLAFAQDLAEGPAKHVLATLLTIVKRKSYETYMGCKLGVLMDAASKSSELGPLVSGMNPVLRNASAHLDFDVQDDCIVLSPGSDQVVLTADEFADVLLELAQVVHALSTAVQLRLLQRGLVASHGVPAGLDPTDLVTVLLASAGLREVRVDIKGATLTIVGAGELVAPMTSVAALSPALPPEVDQVRLEWVSDVVHTLEVRMDLFRDYAVALEDGAEKCERFMVLCANSRFDGQSVLRHDALRALIGVEAGKAISLPLAEAIARLRTLRQLAQSCNDPDAASVLTLVTRATRLRATGGHAEPEVPAALEAIVSWASVAVGQPFLVS
jgi:hypothetical protein